MTIIGCRGAKLAKTAGTLKFVCSEIFQNIDRTLILTSAMAKKTN